MAAWSPSKSRVGTLCWHKLPWTPCAAGSGNRRHANLMDSSRSDSLLN